MLITWAPTTIETLNQSGQPSASATSILGHPTEVDRRASTQEEGNPFLVNEPGNPNWELSADYVAFESDSSTESMLDEVHDDEELKRVQARGSENSRPKDIFAYHEQAHLRKQVTDFFGGRRLLSRERVDMGLSGQLPSDEGKMFNETWRRYKALEVHNQYSAIGESPGKRLMQLLGSPGKEYQADGETSTNESEADSDNSFWNEKKGKGYKNDALQTLLRCAPESDMELGRAIRFCMFNVGQTTKREFWAIIKERMSLEMLNGVVRVEAVLQPNRKRRMDFWVQSRVASKVKAALYMTAQQRRHGTPTDFKYPMRELGEIWFPNGKTKHWRMDVYKDWRDRTIHPKPVVQNSTRATPRGIATFNVNGLHNKETEVKNFLKQYDIGIVALQETLINENHYQLVIPGYETFLKRQTKHFRGHALLVCATLKAYTVGNTTENSMIHVRVAGLVEGQPCHVIAVYLPSGGNYRAERTRCMNVVLKEYKDILRKEPQARVLMMGDWNMRRDRLAVKLKSPKTGLSCVDIRGSGLTFHRKSTRWSDIDSMVVSPNMKPVLKNAKVIRHWGADPDNDSDHFPLVAMTRMSMSKRPEPTTLKTRYNVDLVKGHGARIVNSNRWSALKVDNIVDQEGLDEAAETFSNTVNEIADETGIRTQSPNGTTFVLNRGLKRKVKKVSLARKAWMAATREGSRDANELGKKFRLMRTSVKSAIRKREAQLHEKRIMRVTDMYLNNEMRAFHRWETSVTSKGADTTKATPVKDKDGRLLTSQADILHRTSEYYRDLVQEDPEKLSRNTEYWKGMALERAEAPLDCNEPITWVETLLAIRGMALGTAPGHDTIPIEVFKSLLKEECHRHLQNKGLTIGDNIYVALPEESLPQEPCTPMGRYLYRVMRGMWDKQSQPKFWSKVTNISIYKSGDPTELHNYRGISLIAVGMKIFTAVLAKRISRLAELDGLLVTEQGGFREGQEAVAQFVALAEMARRRRLKDMKTYIIFIDFKKAFDKVMHEALFEKMDAMGFRGPFLELIKNIYKTSTACTRVGNETGFEYDLLRGTRQGCPLSPVLFLLFINDFLKYVPNGAQIPGVTERDGKCAGLLFADDIAGIVESESEVQDTLEGATKWSQTWKMPMGANKCGVMLVGGSEEEQEKLAKTHFEVDGDKVEAVRSYKYLGIYISDKLGDKEGSDEKAHCKVLSEKMKVAIDMRRAFLRDKNYPLELKTAVINSKIAPIGCYGGEWVGLCQERTNIIQKTLNIALKLVLNSSTKSTLHGTKAMSMELGVPTIEQRMADMRIRLWQKAPRLKTWLGVLRKPENRFVSKNKVWTTQTGAMIKIMQREVGKMSDLQIDIDRRVIASLVKEGKYTPLTPNPDDPETTAQIERQDAKVTVIARGLFSDMSKPSRKVKATVDYHSFGYDRTRKYLKSAAYIPALTEGTIWIARVRTNAWWTTRRRYEVLKNRGQPNHLKPNVCPCCKERFLDDDLEMNHILLDCENWSDERRRLLGNTIKFLKYNVTEAQHGRLDERHWRTEISARMLGAMILKSDLASDFKADNSIWTAGPGEEGPTALDMYANAWGGAGESHLPGLDAHGYIVVAKFLAQVMPNHKAALFPNQQDTTDAVMYETTTWEESPVKRTVRPPLLTPSDIEDGHEFGPKLRSLAIEQMAEPEASQADAPRGMALARIHAQAERERHRGILTDTTEGPSELESGIEDMW
jgi:exonuclease III